MEPRELSGVKEILLLLLLRPGRAGRVGRRGVEGCILVLCVEAARDGPCNWEPRPRPGVEDCWDRDRCERDEGWGRAEAFCLVEDDGCVILRRLYAIVGLLAAWLG